MLENNRGPLLSEIGSSIVRKKNSEIVISCFEKIQKTSRRFVFCPERDIRRSETNMTFKVGVETGHVVSELLVLVCSKNWCRKPWFVCKKIKQRAELWIGALKKKYRKVCGKFDN